MKESSDRILYCHCAYAKVIEPDVKRAVLRKLCEEGTEFDAVPDLCEMSARRDPSLKQLAESGPLKIIACYPRAVKWLFHAADAPLSESNVQILNMRNQDPDEIADAVRCGDTRPREAVS